MPRPRKPQWVEPGPGRKGRFRTVIDGKIFYFPADITRDERPQAGGIPQRAWDHLRQLEREAKGIAVAESDPTVYWICQVYLEWAEREVEAGRLTQGQAQGQASRIKLFLERSGLAQVRARVVDADRIAAFFEGLRREYSQHYVAGVGRTVRTIFRWAAKTVAGRTPNRLIAENPLAGYDFPRAPKAVRGYVDGRVVRRFLRWAWGRARRQPGLYRRFDRMFVLLFRFQHLTGCRPGEACDLRWRDIDWEAGRATIPPDRHKTGEETGRDRVIHLTRPVARLLRAIERTPGRHPEYVFTHRRGNHAVDRGHLDPLAGEPWPSGSAASAKVRAWREEAIAAGLPGLQAIGPKKVVAYTNRHRYVSDAVNAGLSHEQTANLVGNSAEVVRQVYAHAIQDSDAERARKLVERGGRSGRPGS